MKNFMLIAIILSSSNLLARSGDTVKPYEILEQENIIKLHDRVPTNIEEHEMEEKDVDKPHSEVGPVRDL